MAETVPERTKRDSVVVFSAFHGLPFGVTVAMSGLIFGAYATTRTHPNSAVNVGWVVLFGIVGIVTPFLVVLLVEFLAAPYKQRREAREEVDTAHRSLAHLEKVRDAERYRQVVLHRQEELREVLVELDEEFRAIRGVCDRLTPPPDAEWVSKGWPLQKAGVHFNRAEKGLPVLAKRKGFEELFRAATAVYRHLHNLERIQSVYALDARGTGWTAPASGPSPFPPIERPPAAPWDDPSLVIVELREAVKAADRLLAPALAAVNDEPEPTLS